MEKRSRSPNYPAFGLATAIEKITTLYKNQHTHPAPREVAVQSMGYTGLNGASSTAISAVMKYGLLERDKENVRISDRAMRILHPQSADERLEAILEAGMEPPLFRELAEKFPGPIPSDEILRNYLIRNKFAPAAVSQVILAYRETSELVAHERGGYDSGPITKQDKLGMQTHTPPGNVVKPLNTNNNERVLAYYEFENGGYVRIIKSEGFSTKKALKMVETLLRLKQEELADSPEPEDGSDEEEIN
ncbi:MAG: hypothetical protein ACOY2B_00585 [Pseudomonadota bacterium]